MGGMEYWTTSAGGGVTETKTILVTAVTGSQGRSTARQLLKAGWRVRGLTRNPESKRAQAMVTAGVELIKGNMGDRATVERALDGAQGVTPSQISSEMASPERSGTGSSLPTPPRAPVSGISSLHRLPRPTRTPASPTSIPNGRSRSTFSSLDFPPRSCDLRYSWKISRRRAMCRWLDGA